MRIIIELDDQWRNVSISREGGLVRIEQVSDGGPPPTTALEASGLTFQEGQAQFALSADRLAEAYADERVTPQDAGSAPEL
jgi:hypothetical protein